MKHLSALVILLSVNVQADDDWQYKISSNAIFLEIVNNLEAKKNVSGLVHALYLLENPEADKKLVELSRYYLGSSTGQELSACVTNRGKEILPVVVEAISIGEQCIHDYCQENSKRLEMLNYWEEKISNGVRIEFTE